MVEILPEYQCLKSIPEIGKVFTAGIIAEFWQIERFKAPPKVAKYAGLIGKKYNLEQHHLKILLLLNEAIVISAITWLKPPTLSEDIT